MDDRLNKLILWIEENAGTIDLSDAYTKALELQSLPSGDMDLKEIHALARVNKRYDEFKADIDFIMNGTPKTIEDQGEYYLVKITANG